MPVPAHAVWRKSSHSGGNTDQCVEVADLSDTVGVRDTKNREAGALIVPKAQWSQLAGRIKSGELDL